MKRAETHRPTRQPVAVTHLNLTVQPHGGRLVQALEAEGVELEGGAAVFGVVKDGDGVVRGAAVGRRHIGSLMTPFTFENVWRNVWEELVSVRGGKPRPLGGIPTRTMQPVANIASCSKRQYLLMMRLHLFRSVEYGVGVAQQLVMTTLNLQCSANQRQIQQSHDFYRTLARLPAAAAAAVPAAQTFGLDADKHLRADLRRVDHVGGVFGVEEL